MANSNGSKRQGLIYGIIQWINNICFNIFGVLLYAEVTEGSKVNAIFCQVDAGCVLVVRPTRGHDPKDFTEYRILKSGLQFVALFKIVGVTPVGVVSVAKERDFNPAPIMVNSGLGGEDEFIDYIDLLIRKLGGDKDRAVGLEELKKRMVEGFARRKIGGAPNAFVDLTGKGHVWQDGNAETKDPDGAYYGPARVQVKTSPANMEADFLNAVRAALNQIFRKFSIEAALLLSDEAMQSAVNQLNNLVNTGFLDGKTVDESGNKKKKKDASIVTLHELGWDFEGTVEKIYPTAEILKAIEAEEGAARQAQSLKEIILSVGGISNPAQAGVVAAMLVANALPDNWMGMKDAYKRTKGANQGQKPKRPKKGPDPDEEE